MGHGSSVGRACDWRSSGRRFEPHWRGFNTWASSFTSVYNPRLQCMCLSDETLCTDRTCRGRPLVFNDRFNRHVYMARIWFLYLLWGTTCLDRPLLLGRRCGRATVSKHPWFIFSSQNKPDLISLWKTLSITQLVLTIYFIMSRWVWLVWAWKAFQNFAINWWIIYVTVIYYPYMFTLT